MSDHQKAQSDLDYVLEEESLSKAAEKKLQGLAEYIDRQQQRIHELESTNAKLREALEAAGNSAGFQYMTHETRELINDALAALNTEKKT